MGGFKNANRKLISAKAQTPFLNFPFLKQYHAAEDRRLASPSGSDREGSTKVGSLLLEDNR